MFISNDLFEVDFHKVQFSRVKRYGLLSRYVMVLVVRKSNDESDIGDNTAIVIEIDINGS
jgi:hypothetical protein